MLIAPGYARTPPVGGRHVYKMEQVLTPTPQILVIFLETLYMQIVVYLVPSYFQFSTLNMTFYNKLAKPPQNLP
jgi:hypothetical protein